MKKIIICLLFYCLDLMAKESFFHMQLKNNTLYKFQSINLVTSKNKCEIKIDSKTYATSLCDSLIKKYRDIKIKNYLIPEPAYERVPAVSIVTKDFFSNLAIRTRLNLVYDVNCTKQNSCLKVKTPLLKQFTFELIDEAQKKVK